MAYSLTVTFEELSCEIIRLRLEDLVSRGLHGRDRCLLLKLRWNCRAWFLCLELNENSVVLELLEWFIWTQRVTDFF